MGIILSDFPKTSGVYRITNIVNNKHYIGSGVDIRNRISHHISFLRRQKHHNRHLQRAWMKYGEDMFTATVVCLVDSVTLRDAEQIVLDEYKPSDPKMWYNICPLADSLNDINYPEAGRKKQGNSIRGENNPFYGKHHSEETKQIMSQHKKGKKLSPAHIHNLEESLKLRYANPEYIKKLRDKYRTNKFLCIETGEVFDSTGDASEKLGITNAISRVLNGHREHICGYHFQYIQSPGPLPENAGK